MAEYGNPDKDLPGSEEDYKVGKEEQERLDILDALAIKITDLFIDRATKRTGKESEWDQAQRLYNSPLQGSGTDYGETPFENSKTNMRRPTPNIVRTKCDAAIANCVSLQFAAGEKNWDIFPPANTKDPQVTASCRLMEKEVQTQLAETKYGLHARRAMEDRVILGTGVMKGPVNSGHMQLKYTKAANNQWLPQITANHSPKVVHVPLWRFFPDDSVADFNESPDVVEIHPFTAIELSNYIKHPGFDGKAIKCILKGDERVGPTKARAYNDGLDKITSSMWERNPYMYKERYLVLEYHGPITFDEVNKMGLVPTYESPTQEYYGEVWVCAGKVIRMELENIEGYYETPYCVATWKRDPTSLFGYGHPLLLADPQRVVTQAYHMILDNASLTSGPQVAMYQKHIQPIDGDWTLAPNKVWLLTDASVDIDNAIQFFNPTNVVGSIMPVLQLARQFAEEESATSAIAQGMQSPQNQESATGTMLMQHASTTLLDFLAEEWDDQVTEKLIRRMYAWNMQYNPDDSIKGDYQIDVKSSSEYKNKQMYIRDLERLQMETAQNPGMAAVINQDELVKARLALMHLPSNRIIRSDEEIAAAQQAAQQQPDPRMIELQIKQEEVAMRKQELQLKAAQLQFEMGKQQQREQWEHEEKMGSNQARLAEANSQVLKARSLVQVEMLQMAQKDEQFAAKLLADKEIQVLEKQSEVFLKSMEESRKLQENELYGREIELKKEFGEGI